MMARGTIVLLATFGLLGAGMETASAATIKATSADSRFSDFTVSFVDSNADGLFEISELTGFVGFKNLSTSFGSLLGSPDIPNISKFASGTNYCGSFPNYWCVYAEIGNTGALSVFEPDYWTYTLDLDPPSAVPIAGALPLLASGLGAIGLIGWRRKRKAEI
jgi:hypothetical protein